MPTTSFSYQNLKCILEHMDPNFRFYLVSRLPQLRGTHHVTPVKIKTLYLGKFAVHVNNVNHFFTSVLYYDHGYEEDVYDDVDECGHREYQWALAESDILLDEQPNEYRWKSNGRRQSRRQYRVYLPHSPKPQFSYDFSNRELKLRDFLRIYLRNFCGSCPNVGDLRIIENSRVIRIPYGLKFRVQNLTILTCSNSKLMDQFQSVLTVSILKNVWIIMNTSIAQQLHNPIIRNCESLELTENKVESWQQPTAESIIGLKSKLIKLKFYGDVALDTLVEVAHHWIQSQKEIGTRLCFNTAQFAEKIELLKIQIGMEDGQFQYEKSPAPFWKCAVKRIDETSALVIYAHQYILMDPRTLFMEIKDIEKIEWL